MPITEELKNVKTLEAVGFDHKQAEAIAGIIEKAQVNGQESLKTFIDNKIDGVFDKINNLQTEFTNANKDLRNEIENKITNVCNAIENNITNVCNAIENNITNVHNEIENKITNVRNDLGKQIDGLEIRLLAQQRDLLIKLFGVIIATAGIAVAVVKLIT